MTQEKTKIVINKIRYKNFKGFDNYTLDLQGKSAKAYGANGTGKTSLADGLQWLFFGKDTAGAKLNPKPLDKNNDEMPGLSPTIEAELIINGKVVLMERVQEEKWTTKHGELEKTRGSDTTKYLIDKVPKKEKEWKDYIATIGNEDILLLQLLSNVGAFMRYDWKNRREVLISMTGLTDFEIIQNDPELKELEQYLEEYTVDEMRKMLAGQKREIKAKIEGVPARIQENKDMLDRLALDTLDKKQLNEQLEVAKKVLEEKQAAVVAVQNGNADLKYKEKAAELNTKLAEAKTTFLSGVHLATGNLQKEISDQQIKVSQYQGKISSLEIEISQLERTVDDLGNKRLALLDEYHRINNQTFDEHQKDCPTCGQALPHDQIDEMISKFNLSKSESLEKNKANGLATKNEIEQTQSNLMSKQQQLELNKKDYDVAFAHYESLQKEFETQSTHYGVFENTKEYKNIKAEIEEVQQQLLKLTANSSQEIQTLKAKVAEAEAVVASIREQLLRFEQAKPVQDRIEALKKEDSELKKQNMDVEKKLFMLDEFTRKKVKLLEESINSKFDIVKFKLFEIQKNGGLNEVCEATFNGVEYSSGLSTGERARCDLDIIKGLQKGLGIEMPVFFDNAESVTEPYEFAGQIIELYAKEEPFRVEVIK